MRVHSFEDPQYRAIVEAQCGVIVPQNELKWRYMRPGPDSFDFSKCDRIFDWADQHKLLIRGHTLLWHRTDQLPAWIADYDFGSKPDARVAEMLQTHIRTICRRYRNRITSYDVVNETIDQDTGLMRETRFSKAMGSGEAVVDLAFHTARAEAPEAELVYNDFMSWEPDGEKHRAGVLRLLEGFRKRGVPVDTLGLQGHVSVPEDASPARFAERERIWRGFLDAATGMGYKLIISEFDVNDRYLPAEIPARDAAVAAFARRFLDISLSYGQLHTLMLWGMVDRYSWLQENTPRTDKLPKRPCPYDADYRAKPLRSAIAASLAAAPVRRS
jgi:endo-1,4-beta-xylanase